jgi:hypothetical protein
MKKTFSAKRFFPLFFMTKKKENFNNNLYSKKIHWGWEGPKKPGKLQV